LVGTSASDCLKRRGVTFIGKVGVPIFLFFKAIFVGMRNRQKRWLGHVLCHASLVRTVLEGRLPVKKGRGRPKEMLLD